jgi:hypothetical protein
MDSQSTGIADGSVVEMTLRTHHHCPSGDTSKFASSSITLKCDKYAGIGKPQFQYESSDCSYRYADV